MKSFRTLAWAGQTTHGQPWIRRRCKRKILLLIICTESDHTILRARIWRDMMRLAASRLATVADCRCMQSRARRGDITLTPPYLRSPCGFRLSRFPRLIHCLLLGHVASAPTVDELRSMLQTFRQKSSLPSRLSDGETLVQPNNAQEDITTKPSDAVARPTAISETIPGLRIEQRHMPGVRMWFEDDDERRELDERGRHGQVPSPSSSAIKAAYCETWIESDGRLNALDLLLTLCAVPQTSLPGSDPIGAGAENPTDGRGESHSRRQVPLMREWW